MWLVAQALNELLQHFKLPSPTTSGRSQPTSVDHPATCPRTLYRNGATWTGCWTECGLRVWSVLGSGAELTVWRASCKVCFQKSQTEGLFASEESSGKHNQFKHDEHNVVHYVRVIAKFNLCAIAKNRIACFNRLRYGLGVNNCHTHDHGTRRTATKTTFSW